MPAALTEALAWQRWGTPPYAGGRRDQPMKLMKAMDLSLMWYRNFSKYQQMVNGEADRV